MSVSHFRQLNFLWASLLPWTLLILVPSATSAAFLTTNKCGAMALLPQTTTTTTTTTTTQQMSLAASSSSASNYNDIISNSLDVLYRAAESKDEDPDLVYASLASLEKNMRTKAKQEESVGPALEESLKGAWRLIFTTGTESSQKRAGGQRINYFPIKAVQTFGLDSEDPTVSSPSTITNSVYLLGIPIVKFVGTYQFDQIKRRVEFDFASLELLCKLLTIPLKQGQAAQVGAATGLGSESNVELAKRDKSAFFNWISADDKIATARGGGGGLALWKRITEEEFDDELPKK